MICVFVLAQTKTSSLPNMGRAAAPRGQ
jgi:hypothetical protein